jgi:hypothetical protein
MRLSISARGSVSLDSSEISTWIALADKLAGNGDYDKAIRPQGRDQRTCSQRKIRKGLDITRPINGIEVVEYPKTGLLKRSSLMMLFAWNATILSLFATDYR